MFDHTHYVPILKGKDGEYGALRDLTATVKDHLTPLIEVPPIPYDFANESPAKTVDEHLEKVAQKIAASWGPKRPMFIDFSLIPDTEVMSDGTQPLTFVLEEARAKNLDLIPVTGLDRASQYQEAVREANKQDGFGICLRLTTEDFDDGNFAANVDSLLTVLNVGPEAVDVIVDLESILGAAGSTLVFAVRSMLTMLPRVTQWRSVTIAASSFPQDLSQVPAQSETHLPRIEWQVWRSLTGSGHTLPRVPTFGDYAIAHPVQNELDPRIIRVSAQLRYTSDQTWLIFKERNAVRYGFDQFNDICRKLVTRSEFKGAAFSAGDGAIAACCAPGSPPGNAMVWRRIGTNHHLTFVVDQIASLP